MNILMIFTTSMLVQPELAILYSLNKHDKEYLQRDICREWSYSLQTVYTTVKKMEKGGLIKLVHNKKNKYIHLTRYGHEQVKRIVLPLINAENQAFEALSPAEQDIFLAVLEKYAKLLKRGTSSVNNPQ